MNDTRITRAISLCNRVVSSFSYSWKKRRELAEVQMQLGVPGHQLIPEAATRWGSRLQMIERVVEQERALAKVLSADKKPQPFVPTWQDIEVLEAIQKALKPLQDFTDTLSEEEYVTLSYVRPVLHLFNTTLLADEEGTNELCKTIKTTLDNLNGKYLEPSTSDLLEIASFLDPQFRAKYIQAERMDVPKRKVILEAESETLQDDQGSCLSELRDPAVHVNQGNAAVAILPTVKRKKSLSFQTSICLADYTGACQKLEKMPCAVSKYSSPAFSKVGWYEGLVDLYMSAVPSVTIANTTCHLPRSDAFRMLRNPVSGDLPWPGLVFGLTVLSTWVWCTDQGAFWGLMTGLVVGLIRMVLEFFYHAPSCGQPESRPAILADVHYLYFSLILLALTCLVIAAVSLATAPIPKEHLHRLTWWSRYSQEPRIDLTGPPIFPDPVDSASDSDRLPDSCWRRAALWLCGLTGPNSGSAPPVTENNELNSLQEDPIWRRVCNVNALLLLSVNVFLWGYMA
ncbi:hypothetical protein F2P81_006186 [Scophthalmus maximus]|uniref:Uncharacterized protein n=1 Tax=Scophthalmus maximus TaxID=52904 RepID=A0A6A4THD9_SCOMX|nr:hypothetical protein F2P81_006186 [Scophthalmus maximus]